MRATIRIDKVRIRVTGDDAGALRAAIGPFLAMLRGTGAVPPDATPGPTMQPEAVAFLAAHGFTPVCFERRRKQDEDVEAFVARRELEAAGLKYSRTAPGEAKRGPTGKLPPELAKLNPPATDREIVHFARVDGGAECAERGCRVHPEPPPIVPDMKGMDPKVLRDRMNAARPLNVMVDGDAIAAALDEKARAESAKPKPETKRTRAARRRDSDEKDALHSGSTVPFSRTAKPSKPAPRGRKAARS